MINNKIKILFYFIKNYNLLHFYNDEINIQIQNIIII